MGVEDLYSLLLEGADHLFTLLVLINLTGVQALPATTHPEKIRLVRAPTIDETVLDPGRLRRCTAIGSLRAQSIRHARSELGHNDSSDHCTHEISAVHALLGLISLPC